MMTIHDIPILDIFAQHPDEAPKNLDEMGSFIERCREHNLVNVVEFLEKWVEDVKEKISQEWNTES